MATTRLGLYGGPIAVLDAPPAGGGVTVSPGAGALTLAGLAPTITTGGDVTVAPAAGVLALAGVAPTVSATSAEFLVLAGSVMRVVTGSFQQTEGTRIGDEARTASGRLRSTVSAIKRRWVVQVAFISTAELETFRALIEPALHVTSAGLLLRGTSPTVRVAITGAETQEYDSDLLWLVGLDVEEV